MNLRNGLTLLLTVIAGGMAYTLASRDEAIPPPHVAVDVPQAEDGGWQSSYLSERERAAATALNLLLDPNSLYQMAALGPLLDLLGPAELERLADQAEILAARRPLPSLALLVAEWTRRDPVSATARICYRLDAYPGNGTLTYNLGQEPHGVCEWARNAPDLATGYALDHPHCPLAPSILASAMEMHSVREAGDIFTKLAKLPGNVDRETMLNLVRLKWQSVDLEGTLAAITAMPPGDLRENALLSTLTDAQHQGLDAVTALNRAVRTGSSIQLTPVVW
jgi:hypothetical protein